MFDILISKPKKFKQEKLKELGLNKILFLNPENSAIMDVGSKEDLRRAISSAHSKNKIIIVRGQDDEINRIVLEDKRISMLLSPEGKRKKDSMHSRNSGLNHILCALASKNDIAIGINYSEFKKMKGKEAAEHLGRVMQNVRLCNQYHAPMVLASFGKKPASIYELRSFALSIGMTTDQAKKSLEKAKELFI
ncbi:MAG: hypothetical protein KKE23_00685 [Nanoarchaeota archaeon]|nr:hypothetical protein [Nanoarchaeota archaeon]